LTVAREGSWRVAVIGGGAAGLFCARLLALRHPAWQIVVHERLSPDETFGFGVGLTGALLKAIEDADPELREDIVGAAFRFSHARFCLPAGLLELEAFHSGVAIGRTELLRLLLRRAEGAGVEVRIGRTAHVDELREVNDLVIAADGVSSATRERLADVLRPSTGTVRGLFVWCGSRTQLPCTTFMPVRTEHGIFVTHAYPYAAGRSTLVIETDEATWRRAGLDDTGPLDPYSAESDEPSLDYLSAAFGDLLGGERLLGNKSRWTRFRTVSCARWRHENVVVIGDAAATAHPSLGSGTKLAMESAIALAESLQGAGGGPQRTSERLAAFETARRPAITRLQERAARSQLWWESFPTRLHLTPARIAMSFVSRAGALTVEDLAGSEPEMVTRAAADYADVPCGEVPVEGLTDWILDRPLRSDGTVLRHRLVDLASDDAPAVSGVFDVGFADPWGAQAAELLGRAHRQMRARPGTVVLTGAADRYATLDRLALAERVRNELGAIVIVAVSAEHLPDAADGLVAGRTDLITVSPPQPALEVAR
jgi:anthraniloyl-CoA monooxygenase